MCLEFWEHVFINLFKFMLIKVILFDVLVVFSQLKLALRHHGSIEMFFFFFTFQYLFGVQNIPILCALQCFNVYCVFIQC